jgi:glycosyltransferase involved in cell wall biosynthesis
MKNLQKFDVCVVSFSDLRFDARTINLVESLVSLNKKVVVFSIIDKTKKLEKIINYENFKNIIIDIPDERRVFVKWFTFVSLIKSIISKYSFDCFWAADLYSLPVCKFLKQKTKNIIYDSREIYSELSTLHNHKIKQKILSKIEEKCLKNVTHLVTSGEKDSEYLKKKFDLKIPISEIKNFPKFKKYEKSNIIRETFNISENQTILLYQGVLLAGRGLIPVMNSMKKFEEKLQNFVLVILGDGNFRSELENYAKKLGISEKVKFAGNIDYAELHSWTCSADIGLCNIEPISFSYELALPNKLFEYILAELPVLATDLPALAEVINSTNCGICISRENDLTEISNSLIQFKNSIDFYKDNSKKAKNNFVYESQISKIDDIFSF